MEHFRTAMAASCKASEKVGWPWIVRAMSSELAPNSKARTHSAIMSAARGPMMCTPKIRSVFAWAINLTNQSFSPMQRARPAPEKG